MYIQLYFSAAILLLPFSTFNFFANALQPCDYIDQLSSIEFDNISFASKRSDDWQLITVWLYVRIYVYILVYVLQYARMYLQPYIHMYVSSFRGWVEGNYEFCVPTSDSWGNGVRKNTKRIELKGSEGTESKKFKKKFTKIWKKKILKKLKLSNNEVKPFHRH